jgi:hypothetical protein
VRKKKKKKNKKQFQMHINSSLFNNNKNSSFPITMASKLLFTAIALLLSTLAIVIFSSETSNTEPLSSARARQLKKVPIVGAFGPESFAFDSLGKGPYASLSDGRIVKWQGNRKGWTDFAVASPNRYACKQQPFAHVGVSLRTSWLDVF